MDSLLVTLNEAIHISSHALFTRSISLSFLFRIQGQKFIYQTMLRTGINSIKYLARCFSTSNSHNSAVGFIGELC